MKKLTILSLMLLTFMVMGCNNQPKDKSLTDGTFHSVGLNLTGTINVDVTIEEQRITEVHVLEELKTYASQIKQLCESIIENNRQKLTEYQVQHIFLTA